MNIGLMKLITSIQNEQVKNWRKLHTKKHRNQMQCFLIEGFHLIEEAIKSGFKVETIIVAEQIDLLDTWQGVPIVHVTDEVLLSVSQTKTPQGVIAVVQMKSLEKRTSGPVLLLDGLQDPGNVGTIIRTADAMGASEVLIGKGTVDIYNDKVIRSTQGSIFHIRLEQVEIKSAIAGLKEAGYTVWASSLQEASALPEVEFTGENALIVGNEGAGIDEEVLNLADKTVKIPIYGDAESLNVSVATGIMLYALVK